MKNLKKMKNLELKKSKNLKLKKSRTKIENSRKKLKITVKLHKFSDT